MPSEPVRSSETQPGTRLGRLELRYATLLVTVVLVLLLVPTLHEAGLGLVAASIAYPAVLLTGAFAISEARRARPVALVLLVATLAGDLILILAAVPGVALAARVVQTLYLGLVTLVILVGVMRHEEVTSDTILGGICVYLLIGVVFVSLYTILEILQPGSFLDGGARLADVSHAGHSVHRYPQLTYYSFVTLTTLGYGDITPAGALPRVLSATQAVVGQLYVAIFIARLVGLYISGDMRSKR